MVCCDADGVGSCGGDGDFSGDGADGADVSVAVFGNFAFEGAGLGSTESGAGDFV
jgi:hypothetical protein